MKKLLSAIVLAMLASLVNVTPVQAIVSFSADGTGDFVVINEMDWRPGVTNGRNLNQAVRNFKSGSGDTEFIFFYQAALGTYTTGDDINIMPTGTELTILMGMRQNVVAASGSDITISYIEDPEMFLEIYYDPTKDADTLLGTGFNNERLILQASITGSDDFVLSMGTPNQTVALDQYGADDFPGLLTTIMNGQTTVRARVDAYDPMFFDVEPDSDEIRVTISNYGTGTPFVTGNPSSQFVLGRNPFGIGFPSIAPTIAGAGSSVGPINGDYTNEEYRDSIFGTDTSSIFKSEPRQIIPEPMTASLSIMSASSLALICLRRRRQR